MDLQDGDSHCGSGKIVKKYGDLQGTVIIVDLQKGPNGLGLSLAGHKDRTKMSTFIVGLNPTGNAFKDGRILVGDEILEVNGQVLYGRCHLNASAIIKGLTGNSIKFVLLRRPNALADLAVKPVTHFPVNVGDEPQATTENQLSRFKEIRTVMLKKGPTGFGVMIMEGKHNEAGQGIFISDIQEGSAAEQAGLTVGDMILSVNDEDLLGANYETAASLLKKAEGTIRVAVSNPNKLQEPIKKDEKPAIPPKPTSFSTKSFLPHMQRLLKTPSPTNVNLSPSPTSIIGGLSPTTPSTLEVTTITVAPSPTGASPSTANVSPVTPLTPTMKPHKLRSMDDPALCDIVTGCEVTIEIAKEKMGLGLSIVGGSDTLLGAIIIHEVYPDGAAAKDGRLRPGDQILEVNNENLRDSTHDHAIGTLRQTPSKVKMVVFREESPAREEDAVELFEVELLKKPGKGLGLSIVGRKNGPGVFVSDVVKGGAAEADGRLIQGDQIISVNGHDLKNAMQEQAAAILKTSMGRIHMKVGRLKVVPHRTTNGSTGKPNGTSDGCKTIALDRGVDGLGFSIVGGYGSPHGDLPIYVKTVFEKGAASENGQLKRGDQIVAVNGQQLEGYTHEKAVTILKNAKGTVTLTVLS
uniref:PDZ domain-containing protein n=1 Tax=Strigamia maritima TaxID=126957 RepID=T1JLQ1_STRMM